MADDRSLLEGLVAYWQFQHHPVIGASEGGNNRIIDKSGHGNHLQPRNFTLDSPGVTPGKIGNGFEMDGGSQFFTLIPSYVNLSHQGNDFRAFFWYKPLSLSDGASIVSNNEWSISMLDVSGEFFFTAQIEGKLLVSTLPLVVGTWYLVEAGYKTETGKPSFIYISVRSEDGKGGDRSILPSITTTLGPFIIGGNGSHGVIDDFGIYRRSLTFREKARIWNGGDGLAFDDYVIPECKALTCCH